MQVVKPLDKKPSPLKYSTNPSLKKPVKQPNAHKKVEFKHTFLNPC